MDKLSAMGAFVKVVSLGSFTEAAEALGLTRSAVSKAVMGLEHLLGSRLLDRTTRRVSPTEAGRAYHEACLDILSRVEETELQVSRLHDEPRGVLKMNAPMSFGVLHVGPAVADFMARYPELKVELTLNDRYIDPVEEGVDITVRIGALADSSLVARKIAPARLALVASPAYLRAAGIPKTPDDIARHRCLTYGHTTQLQRWQLMREGESVSVPVNSVLCSNNGDVLRTAALEGEGLTLLPTFLIGRDIKEKRLRAVLPDYAPREIGIYALYAPNRYLAAKTRVMIDFLAERFAGSGAWDNI